MMKINQLLQECDFFGAVFKPSANTVCKQYKSNFGGLISLLIFLSSLSYLTYNLVIWQMGLFLPTTINSQSKLTEGQYSIEENSLVIMCSDNECRMDVFNQSNMILQPTLQKLVKGKPGKYLDYKIQLDTFTQLNEIVIPELNYTINFAKEYEPSTKYLIKLSICNQERASKLNQTCASQQEINDFLTNFTKLVTLKFNLRQFNEQKKEIEIFKYQNIFLLNNQTLLYSQAYIMLEEAIVDDGFLFPQKTSQIFNQNIDILNQQASNNQVTQIVEDNTLFFLTLKLHPLKTVKYIQYLKINELLASAGSIIQIIFYISIIAQYYNSSKFNSHITDKVISFYYPQFSNITISKSVTGKIKNVYSEGKQIDLRQFNTFYEKAQCVAQQKLTFLNILYEISRIQFICMNYFKSRKIFQDSHVFGINLPSDLSNLNSNCQNKFDQNSANNSVLESLSPGSRPEMQLLDADFEILMKPNHQLSIDLT